MNVRLPLVCLAIALLAPISPAANPPGTNTDEAKVGTYTLPDPLTCADGSAVADVATWKSKRRPELVRLFESEIYGRVPKIASKPTFDVLSSDPAALDGKATRKLVRVWLLGTTDGPAMELLLYLPNGRPQPAPAFLGLNFVGNQSVSLDPAVPLTKRWVRPSYVDGKSAVATEATRGLQASRWPIETALARGYAVVTAYYGDIEEDHPEGWKNGVRGAVLQAQGRTEFAPGDWGAVAAWAWGLSRALDYLETDPAIDAKHVVVHGHSRLGKAALWAGAQDERFAIAISNDSGEGGAALKYRDFGETPAVITKSFPHWFTAKYSSYGADPKSCPVDQHELIALLAPRPVYIASASEDLWADPKGEFLAGKHAEPVYAMFGKAGLGTSTPPAPDSPIGDRIGYHLRTGKHDITAYDWGQYLDFADRHLGVPQKQP